jgi:ubiquinone/menaquinone biosynthesis C-methylase UbiE
MDTKIDEIRNSQRDCWNKFSAGWGKWDDLTMEFLHPPGKMMLDSINWNESYHVLDLASGTGEPGLTAAKLVPQGKVISTDLSEEMNAIAAEKARQKGLKNFETGVCSADSIPFDSDYFDIVLCRFGFMFFPDILSAAKEIRRVLKPGGFISAAVWSVPEKNQWATTIMSVINKLVDMPVPAPDSPGLFRCAQPGYIKNYFDQAGFTNISEKTVDFEFSVDSIQDYWSFMTEVAAPVVAGLNKADNATREKIKSQVFENAEKYKSGAKVNLPCSAIVITAQK